MPEPKRDAQDNPLDDTSVFIVKRMLLGGAWCCAPKSMNLETVQREVHRQCEPYIEAMHGSDVTPWTVAPRQHDDPELVSPGHCAEVDDRQHWLLIGGVSGVFIASLQEDSTGYPDDLPMQTAEQYHAARLPDGPRDRENPLQPIFANHDCSVCNSGAKPCREGNYNCCSNPRARND